MNYELLDDTKELVLKLAAIAGQIDQRNRAGTQQIENGVQSLNDTARRLHDGADQFASAVVQQVGAQVQSVVAERSAAALDRFNEQLRASTGRVQWAAEALAEQRKLLSAAQRTLVFKGLLALLIGSVLAAATGSYLLWQVRHLGGDPALTADIRQAVASGALTRCNQDQLCARTAVANRDSKQPRHQYVIVR
jgi:hypothetical protein